jgi:hypothetical protein
MRKTWLIIGIVLLILAVAAGVFCLLLPWLTGNRVNFREASIGLIPVGIVFLLGLIATLFSTVFILVARKQSAQFISQIQPEGIVLHDDGVKSSATYRNFRSPGRYNSFRRNWFSASVALTKTRLFAVSGSSPLINVPFTDQRLQQMKFSVEGDKTLLVAFAANLFQPDWSGDIEYRFKTIHAKEYLEMLTGLHRNVAAPAGK